MELWYLLILLLHRNGKIDKTFHLWIILYYGDNNFKDKFEDLTPEDIDMDNLFG